MDKKKLSASWAIAFTVASVWFGTHVGGGFASGNQVIGYFAQFGSMGSLLFPLIAMGLLAIVMGIILKFARLNGFDNYKDTFAALYPHPKMEILFEIFYIVIILAAVAAAVAGAGEVLANFLGVPYVGAMKVVFNLLIVALLVILSIFGVKLVAADGASRYIREYLEEMDEETFEKWLSYHFATCERQDLIGATNHALDILRKV